MPETSLAPVAAASTRTGRHGRANGPPGLTIQEITGREVVSIAARRGRASELAETMQRRWGLALPQTPRFVGDDRLAFVWSGANQWLAHAPGGAKFEQQARTLLDGLASITAQGDGRVILQVRGPAVRTVLATGVALDLHPRAFTVGDTAITLAGHIGIQLRQLDDAPSFELTAFRSFADDLCTWLTEAGAPHGVDMLAPLRCDVARETCL